ncbi:MAG: protein kinase [Mycolicibacterium sp.]|uniref:serine/threonine-protein kinase n=1 Tax=Mycolicibacterium sp. TaxID=2320850 RepID=UPI003D14BF7C
MFSVGSVVGGYRLERVLGAGGMGAVYLAQSPNLPRREAVKVLSPELSEDPAFRERLVREAEIASMLDHPNIVSIHGRGESDGQLWIAMQFVDGTDAETALRAGTMTPLRAVHIVTEAAHALDYAHHRNVVHADVKPANLLLSGSGDQEKVLLSDFGVARRIDDAPQAPGKAFTTTLAYSPPEALTGGPVDGRSDVYSLGCTLFRLLTGRQPFAHTQGDAATIRAHLEESPPKVSDYICWATTDLDHVIATAMAKDPQQRFASAREFAAAAAAAVRRAAAPASAAPYRPQTGNSPPPPPMAVLAPPAVRPRSDPDAPEPHEVSAPPPEFGEIPNIWANVPGPHLSRSTMLWGGAAAAGLAIVLTVILIATIGGAPPPESASASPAPTTAESPQAPPSATAEPAARARLNRILPPGYPPGACTPADAVPPGAAAVASCAANTDPGGPVSATYTLALDDKARSSAFDQIVGESTTVVCPGRIQSPGPWRRRSNPDTAVGMLYCGVRDGSAVLAWTTDADLLLAVTRSPQHDLPTLYRWWTSHS